MRRPPTHSEAERIRTIVNAVEVRFPDQYFDWHGHAEEARQLCTALSGHKLKNYGCFGCRVTVLDILREAINLPPASPPVSGSLFQARMTTCRECPTFQSVTQSCGTLIIDALIKRTVTHPDGTTFQPCGCEMLIKANWKNATCPAQRWTR